MTRSPAPSLAARPPDMRDTPSALLPGRRALRDPQLPSSSAAATGRRAYQPAWRPLTREIQEDRGPADGRDRIFHARRYPGRGGPERFDTRGGDEHDRNARAASPSPRSPGPAPRDAACAGRDQRMADPQPGGARQDDRRQLEGRMRRDERKERRREALRQVAGDRPGEDAVVGQEEQRAEPGEEPARKALKRHADVVADRSRTSSSRWRGPGPADRRSRRENTCPRTTPRSRR